MSMVKKQQCPSCGGNLTVDSNKQIYCCLSCGSTYDYEYFREEKLHDMGEKYLSRGEFLAAADTFNLILQKDPRDFRAHRGQMLIAAHLMEMDELECEDNAKEFSYDSELVSETVNSASEEDREYFDSFRKLYSDKENLLDLFKEIESLRAEKNKINDTITRKHQERENCYAVDRNGVKHSPKTAYVLWWIFDGFLFAMTIYMIVACFETYFDGGIVWATLFTIATVAGVAVLNQLVTYRKVKRMKDLDKTISELCTEAGKKEEQIRDLSADVARLEAELRISSHDFVNKDKMIMREYE